MDWHRALWESKRLAVRASRLLLDCLRTIRGRQERDWTVRCIRCGEPIQPAVFPGPGETEHAVAWECPADAVLFDGGWSFGSTLYDAMMADDNGNHVYVQVVVCDPCIKSAVHRGLARERTQDSPRREGPWDSRGKRQKS